MTFLRTGTDNAPFETASEFKPGYGEVVSFPVQNRNAPVSKISTKPEAASLSERNAPVSIVKQAKLGRLICEQCKADVEKKTFNQRFCCSDCRITYHNLKR
jgi:hypothetical protein